MKYYHNLSVVLPVESTDTIKSRLEDIRLERVNNPYLMNAYNELTIKNSYTKHMWANKIIESLGFSLLDLDIRLQIQVVEDIIDNDWIKDTLSNSSIEYFLKLYKMVVVLFQLQFMHLNQFHITFCGFDKSKSHYGGSWINSQNDAMLVHKRITLRKS